jgi:hypothetical protein
MADRSLPIPVFIELFRAHGCTAHINSNQVVIIVRGSGPGRLFWTQHAHKGLKDEFHRRKVAAARRRVGFGTMSDAEFYAPID